MDLLCLTRERLSFVYPGGRHRPEIFQGLIKVGTPGAPGVTFVPYECSGIPTIGVKVQVQFKGSIQKAGLVGAAIDVDLRRQYGAVLIHCYNIIVFAPDRR